ATDVLVDPQLGRFMLDLTGLGIASDDLRVDYILALTDARVGAKAFSLEPIVKEVFSFAADGSVAVVRDAFDGTPIAVKVRLGSTISEFEGTARGWTIFRNGVSVSATLAAELKSLDDVGSPVTPGRIAVDLERGRFKFPAGVLSLGDVITVSAAVE